MTQNRTDGPSSEQVKRVLQEALLRNYPNPDRTGCPGAEILREMAQREFPHEDPFWDEHVSHCSPCYREFLDFRNRVLALESRKQRNASYAAAVAVILLVTVGAIYFFTRQSPGTTGTAKVTPPQNSTVPQISPGPRPADSVAVAAVLNLESESITRSAPSGTPNVGGEIQRIPRGRLDLSIYLPVGSEAGQYEVQLMKSPSDQSPLNTSTGTAQIENGLSILRITPDFSAYEAGTYILAIRRSAGAWRYYRVVLS
jgi:hypothetical protein